MTLPCAASSDPAASGNYWRRIFARNPDFCSWQAPQQRQVLEEVRASLRAAPGPLRVLDYGIGNLGLYRSLDDALLRRLRLLGISESVQHDPDDPLLRRHAIEVATGPGLSPLAAVAPRSQDRVVCTYVFAYLSARARSDALHAFARVLAPGGRLILVLHHPRGERARKLRSSAPFWPAARELYAQLLAGRDREARAQLSALAAFVEQTFARDPGHRRYLASYLRTAARFLAAFCAGDQRTGDVPDVALQDCEELQRCIDREQAMTCDAFDPVVDPERDLAWPQLLAPCGVCECADPGSGSPIANVLSAVRRDVI